MSSVRLGRPPEPRRGDGGGFESRGPFLKDFDRIVYSSAFRRLQDKTQVYSFPTSDYVRTRLTHSLEVSAVGRSLGLAVGKRVCAGRTTPLTVSGYESGYELGPGDVADVVAAASLAHDIGHPPFGHAGEEAVRHFFRHDRPELLADLTPAERSDLVNFESNAQGFRVLTRLQLWRDRGGMRLCASTLGAFSKYPWGSLVGADSGPGHAKFGFYDDDRATFAALAEHLGLAPGEQPGSWRRHPLAYLVEAADDICYLVVDLEDGSMARLLDFAEVEAALLEIVGDDLAQYRQLEDETDRLAYLRAKAIGVLVGQTVDCFRQAESEVLEGRYTGHLLDGIRSQEAVRRLRQICNDKLYNDPSKLRKEIGGFAIVRGVLEVYTDILAAWERSGQNRAELPYFYRRAMRLLPDAVLQPRSRYGWLLAVLDYVSGMTNRFAVAQYRMLRGLDVDIDNVEPGV